MSVTVISGANSNELNLDGLAVGQVRSQYGDALGIAPSAVATINGERVDADHTLEDGDELRFTKETGKKG